MKKSLLIIGLTTILILFSINVKFREKSNKTPKIVQQNTNSTPFSLSIPQTSTQTTSFKNGSYTGNVADAIYGNVQLKVEIQNGKISNIQFLQYPNSGGHTSMLSNYALPILKSEVLQKQTDQVNTVSGATQTSRAFNQSLQSALAQAR